MDARLRESFLRELMILQSCPIDHQSNREKEAEQQQQQQQQLQHEQSQCLHKYREVDLLFFDKSGWSNSIWIVCCL
jgi:hypothetical protein